MEPAYNASFPMGIIASDAGAWIRNFMRILLFHANPLISCESSIALEIHIGQCSLKANLAIDAAFRAAPFEI